MRKCKCGCGEELKSNRWQYKRGHKPKDQLVPEPEETVEEETTAEDSEAADSGEEDCWNLQITLTDSQIEAAWQRLSPQQKAGAIQYALEQL